MNYKDINDYEMLYLIKEKDDVAEEIIYHKYRNMIKKIASKYISFARSRGAEMDDLLQEGYIGLAAAIREYRVDNHNLFFTFACVCIERQISTYCKRLNALKHESLNCSYSLDNKPEEVKESFLSAIGSSKDNPERLIILEEVIAQVIDFKHSLREEASFIFELRMNGFSYLEIATLLDLSLSTVDSYLCQVRRQIRRSSLAKRFLQI